MTNIFLAEVLWSKPRRCILVRVSSLAACLPGLVSLLILFYLWVYHPPLIVVDIVRKERGYQARMLHSQNELSYQICAMVKNELQCGMKLCGLHLWIIIHCSKAGVWFWLVTSGSTWSQHLFLWWVPSFEKCSSLKYLCPNPFVNQCHLYLF